MIPQNTIDLDVEKKELVTAYRRLLSKAKPILNEGDARLIKQAFRFSLNAHKDMRRKSQELYIFHPLAVAEICVEEIGLGTTAIIAALIHDVVEDTEIELNEIERLFGDKIAKIVGGLTKVSGFFDYGTSAQAENFRKMIFTLSEDVRVILIKLADRLHNMRTLESLSRTQQLKIASETIYLYAPLAHRLGLNAIKTELEDLSLRFTDRAVYQQIMDKISQIRNSRNRFINFFSLPLRKELDRLDISYTIINRPKSVYSIYHKMHKQDVPFEEIYDLFAIRIVLDAPIEHEKFYCWQVYSIVTDFYTPKPDRLRDWISTPKGNGYEALHTTVMTKRGRWVEVQIRTKRMDDIAEKGYAAHWKYKDNTIQSESNFDKWLFHVRETLESQNMTALEFIDDFRGNLFTKEIFLFTPKGELKTLPVNSTVLDFAFDIHTDIGAQCIGAKVNQKLMSVSHILKTGDQIEILTSSKQKPVDDWLRFVITQKAKSKIKDLLKEGKRNLAEEGKDDLIRKIKYLKLHATGQLMDQIRLFFSITSLFELYYQFGIRRLTINDLKRFKESIMDSQSDSKSLYTKKDVIEHNKDMNSHLGDVLMIGKNIDVVTYKLARCCTPIPGDEVFGFATVSEGIKIHRTNCSNAPKLLSNQANRVIKAKWTAQQELAFLTGIKVTGTDRVGLINDVSKIISEELKVNMRSISFRTEEGIFEGEIMLYVQDTSHLDWLISKLRKVDQMVKVDRFDSANMITHEK